MIESQNKAYQQSVESVNQSQRETRTKTQENIGLKFSFMSSGEQKLTTILRVRRDKNPECIIHKMISKTRFSSLV